MIMEGKSGDEKHEALNILKHLTKAKVKNKTKNLMTYCYGTMTGGVWGCKQWKKSIAQDD